mmetsp:Transcript_18599/g.27560  ORF Transcript_18599/g.27560 Transcript_18599/m.27560 type:complete len:346 (+) Transcript_18599:320-1357(+)
MKDDADQEYVVAASDVQVEELTGVNDNAKGAAEDVVEPRDVENEPESGNLNTLKEQDKLHTEDVARVNASEEDPADTLTEEGPTPVHAEDHKGAAIDADDGAASVKTREEKADADQEPVVARVEESTSSKDDSYFTKRLHFFRRVYEVEPHHIEGEPRVYEVEPRHVEGEPEFGTIKSETILERHHDTEVVVGAHSLNVNKAEEQHVDTSTKEWLSLLNMEDQGSTATDADELVSAVKTEEGKPAIVGGDKDFFEEESSIVKPTEVASSLSDEKDRVRIEAEEEEKAALLKLEAEEEDRAARFQALDEMRLGIEAQDSARKLSVQNERRRTESEKRNSLFSGRKL